MPTSKSQQTTDVQEDSEGGTHEDGAGRTDVPIIPKTIKVRRQMIRLREIEEGTYE
jgi:hypothetical protein